jgi:mevalonate kinase
MIAKNTKYYAKIMLFGEYSVIFNSMGLTVPYTHFNGELSFINGEKYTDLDFARGSNEMLKDYFPYVHRISTQCNFHPKFDLKGLENDLNKGLYFESTIPLGYGLGSSGALVAALYDKYATNKIQNDRNLSSSDILTLKKSFATMESFFHGKSSGLDPLNSYIKYPLLIKSHNEIEKVGIPRKYDGNGAIFIVNTNKVGKTGPLVTQFLDNYKDPEYAGKVDEEFIPLTNASIKALIKGELGEFFRKLKKLSKFQLYYLTQMIPEPFQDIWLKGLDTAGYYMKLCGSGGGGFLLGFTRDYYKTRAEFAKAGYQIIPVYQAGGISTT